MMHLTWCPVSLGRWPSWVAAAVLFLIAAPSGRAGQLETWVDTSVDVTSASGPGAADVSLPRSGAATSWLGLDLTGDLNGWDSKLSMNGHWTDNLFVDTRAWNVSSIYGEFTKKSTLVRLGDNQCQFSAAGLDNWVRGLYWKQGGIEYGVPELQVSAGSILRDDQRLQPVTSQQPRATLYDVMVRHALDQGLVVGVEAASVHEYHRPVPEMPLREGSLYGLTWSYEPIWGVKFTGESHLSRSRKDSGPDAAHGSAHRVTFTGDGPRSRLTMVYERVSPDYLTQLGSLSTDMEWARATWRQKIGSVHALTFSNYWQQSNLEHSIPAAFRSIKPMVRFDARRLGGNPSAQAGVAVYYLRTEDVTSEGVPYVSRGTWVRLDHANRLLGVDLDAAVERQITRVSDDASPNKREWNVDATLSTSLHGGGDSYVRPEISYARMTRREELTGTAADLLMERFATGVSADLPAHRLRGSLRLGTQKVRVAGRSAIGYATCSLYWKPFPKPDPAREVIAYLQARYNDLDSDVPLSEYNSTSVTLGMNLLY